MKILAADAKTIELRLDGVDAINNLNDDEIDERLQLLSENKTISFTMEEFETYP